MTPVIELKNVTMEYRISRKIGFRAARNIDLAINDSEIIAVVGESGCGKSTIGKICLGVLKPTSGQVFLNGQDIWSRKFKWKNENRHMVQIVHQDSYASLNPLRTLDQTLGDIMKYHKMSKGSRDTEKKVIELLELVGITPAEYFLNKYPFQLSGGQRQRVSIARATILKPKLIIADEPVSAVDASLRLSILNLMRKLNEESRIAFLYITHDLATARFLVQSGRMIVMYFGSLVEEGPINSVTDAPRHPYLQALLRAIAAPDPAKAKRKYALPLKSLDMPTADNPPNGCPFHPRCPYATELCETESPSKHTVGNDHVVSCYLDGVPSWEELLQK